MRSIVWVLAAWGVWALASDASAAESNFAPRGASKSLSSVEKKTAPKPDQEEVSVDQMAELETDRRKELDNSRWSVMVVAKGADYQKDAKKDTLVFQNQQVAMESFQEKGYGPGGYSLVLHPDKEGGTWETYLRGKEGALSLRGDWSGEKMNGVMSLEEGEGEDKEVTVYYFSSQEKALTPVGESGADAAAGAALSGSPAKALVSREE